MTYLYKDLYDLWQKLYAAQQAKGSPLTIQEMMPIMQVQSKNSVIYVLNLLVAAGFMQAQVNGKYHRYIANEPSSLFAHTGGPS